MNDIEHFEVFMRNYQDMVYSTAVRLLGHEADAQDIAQTVFLKAYECFGAIRHSPTAGGWLKTVTTHLCLNHLSRYRARWRFSSDLRREDEETDYLDSVAAPDRLAGCLDEADHRRILEMALRKLPEVQRVPLVLYHFEDLTYEEIASRLKVSLAKVKTDIHRARLALKRYLKPALADDERFEARPDSTRS